MTVGTKSVVFGARLDPDLVRRAAEAYHAAGEHLRPASAGGSNDGGCYSPSADDILARAGIHFDEDPRLYCDYDRALRRAAEELAGA